MDRTAARATATFVPYYWEAYNEIVEPRRFDHYLVTKWLPELGTLGFGILKVLRDRCYHNPQTGILRDSCEIELAELAASVGVSVATLVREFSRNEALDHFVRRVKQFKMVDGRPRQDANIYQVSMDDPIHPNDLERYDDLRAQKEIERDRPAAKHVVKGKKERSPYDAQNEHHRGAYDAQNEHRNTHAQNEHADTSCLGDQNAQALGDLPSGDLLTEESLTPAAAVPQPNGCPPGGETSPAPPELLAAWPLALQEIAEVVNPPTYHTHIARLIPLDLTEGGEVALLVPSAFTRSWLECRHLPAIESALRKALQREVITVRLTEIAPGTGAAMPGQQ